jgi:guanylate kinase
MSDQKPALKQLTAFKKILNQYQASDHALKVVERSRFVALSGIAGGGRNTLISYLTEHAPYYFIVSDTTRPPKVRDGKREEHGVHYFFRTEEDLLADLEKGEFLEAEIIHNQQVSGISIREIEKAAEHRLIPITDVELGGAEVIHRLSPSATIIGLLPPSFEDWQYRLSSREEMHGHEFKNRMETAVKVLESMLKRDYIKFVISGDLNESSSNLRDIVEHGHYTEEQHEKGLETARTILKKTKALVKTL